MSKSLEALERIKHNVAEIVSDDYHWEDYVNDIDLLEEELKALEVVKRNPHEVAQCLAYNKYSDYIMWYKNFLKVTPPLTEEEFKLVKEIITWKN